MPNRRAFTLAELLVVTAVAVILTALLLPAIQAARESGRRAQCQSNLKQIGLCLLGYHDTHRTFPHGGWGHRWVGVPERGAGKKQPGGWIYSILPFAEEHNLYDLGADLTGMAASGTYSRRLQTPICLFVCPSRRACAPWPISDRFSYVRTPRPFGDVTTVARADYAINAGSSHVLSLSGPADLSQGDEEAYWRNGPSVRKFSGISHLRTAASMRSILDGASKTYLVGDKHVGASHYTTGESIGDNESLYAGYCTDLHRFGGAVERIALSLPPYAAPLSDTSEAANGIDASSRFGSAHSSGFNMLHCDGSLQFVTFNIDTEVHFRNAHRHDEGRPIQSLFRTN